ncbi:MAG: acyclic terpene utilization AtuA family protein [Acidobacteriota bacterium]
MKSVRIGAGAGFAGDRIDPAVELAEFAQLDFLVFECLAERTIALSHIRKRLDADGGYDPLLAERMSAVLPACRRNGTRVISNMGAANPRAAARKTVEIARSLGLHGLRVACVEGDDVLHHRHAFKRFNDEPLPDPETCLSANAYLGADAVANALNCGADVVLTGRVADPSLFLGALVHEFGWDSAGWDRLGQGTVIGHLLECAGQLTGGYFADPGHKDVPDLERIGFPFAEVNEEGCAVLMKLDGTGGLINRQTCTEQILYEVTDPARYVTPDVVADFSGVRFAQEGPDKMRVWGGRGQPQPRDYKVSLGMDDGVIADAQISYAGRGAVERAELARTILERRLARSSAANLRIDLIGLNAMHSAPADWAAPYEVRLRAAARFESEAAASVLAREVESLYLNGPAGGAGVTAAVRENIAIVPALIARELVTASVSIEEV